MENSKNTNPFQSKEICNEGKTIPNLSPPKEIILKGLTIPLPNSALSQEPKPEPQAPKQSDK